MSSRLCLLSIKFGTIIARDGTQLLSQALHRAIQKDVQKLCKAHKSTSHLSFFQAELLEAYSIKGYICLSDDGHHKVRDLCSRERISFRGRRVRYRQGSPLSWFTYRFGSSA